MRLKDIDDSAFETWVEERSNVRVWPKAPRFTPDSFCDSPEWRALRAQVLEYYGKECMKCEATDCVIQVDHIRPKSLYPELRLEFKNMQVLCRECNRAKAQSIRDYRSPSDKRLFKID